MRKILHFCLVMIVFTMSMCVFSGCNEKPIISGNAQFNNIETYSVKLPDIYGFNFNLVADSEYSTEKGGSFSFGLETVFNDKSHEIIIKANGNILTSSDNIYTISNITSNINITVEGDYTDIYSVSYNNLPNGVSMQGGIVYFEQDYTFELFLEPNINLYVPLVKANGNILNLSNGKYTVENVTENQIITVENISLNVYSLNYLTSEGGTITGDATQRLTHGESATVVIAAADDGYVFMGWSDGIETEQRTDLNVIGDKTVYALFARETNNISYVSDNKYSIIRIVDNEEIIFETGANINYNEFFDFKVAPFDAYNQSFITVKANDNIITPTEGIYSLGGISEDVIIEVLGITENTYDVNFIAPNCITFLYDSGSNISIQHGGEFTFKARISEEYSQSQLLFKANNQIIDGQIIEEEIVYTVSNITAQTTLTVEGVYLNTYSITYNTDGGRQIADEYVFAGGSITLPYAFKNDCLFNGWKYSESEELYKNGDNIFNIQSDLTFTAQYLEATDGLIYENINAQCRIFEDDEYSGVVVIPDMHDDVIILTVTNANVTIDGITGLLTGDYIENWLIDMDKFFSITTIKLPANLKTIGLSAFSDDHGNWMQISEIVIPSGVEEIPEACFYNNSNLTKVTFEGNNIKKIRNDAFRQSGITSIVLPEGITEIGSFAFNDCLSITSVAFPSTLESIGQGAFKNSGITSVNLPLDVEFGTDVFSNCGSLVTVTGNINGSENLFFNCVLIENISVSSLAPNMFGGCLKLNNVNITADVIQIPEWAFSNCINLENITFTDKNLIIKICDYAFLSAGTNNFALDGLNSLQEIGIQAFGFSAISSLLFTPINDFTLKDEAFYCCSSLTTFGPLQGKIMIPAKLVLIGEGNFSESNISELLFEDNLAIENIPDNFCYHSNIDSSNITIPEGIISIGENAFSNIIENITKIDLPSTLTEIGNNAFSNIDGSFDKDIIIRATKSFTIGEDAFILSGQPSNFYVVNVIMQDWLSDFYNVEVNVNITVTYMNGALGTYLATFMKNDGSNSQYTEIEFELYIEKPINPIRNGYIFEGWTYTQNGTDFFDFSAMFDDITLYAKWQKINYEIIYYTAQGASVENPDLYTITDEIILNDAVLEGYLFEGWYDNANFEGQEITDINAGTTGNLKLYAKFTQMVLTVSFDTKGGSTIKNILISYGEVLFLEEQSVKEGYYIENWYTDSNFLNVYNFSLPVSYSFTLYAKWTGQPYLVRFIMQDAELYSGTYYTGETINQYTEDIEGYTITGWYEDSGLSVLSNFPYTVQTSNKNFYASWQANTYNVEFITDGGGTAFKQKFTYDKEEYLWKNIFEKTGYTFMGWSREESGAVCYNDESTVINLTGINNQTVKLYAVWQANSFDIAFYNEGGNGAMDNQSFIFDTPQNLSQSILTKTGYSFAGWSIIKGGNVVYADNAEVSNLTAQKGEVIALYAVWQANSYSVVYNNCDGNGTMDNQLFAYGTAQALAENTFEKIGYTFAGWAEEENGEIFYNDGANVNNLCSLDGDIKNLYAIWTVNNYTITFNNGTGETILNESVTFNTVYNFNDLVRTGYTFEGWYLYSDFTENITSLTITKDLTVYAKWQALQYNVTFISQGVEFAQTTADYGSVIERPSTQQLEYIGEGAHSFLYWSLSEINPQPYDFNTVVTDNIELYAIWGEQAVSITVLNNLNGESSIISGNATVTINESDIVYGLGAKLICYYTDIEYTTPVEFPLTVAQNTIIYAKYIQATDNLQYIFNYATGKFTACLTNNTENVIVSDTYSCNGFYGEVTEFDAYGYTFTSFIPNRFINKLSNISGYEGNTLILPKYLQQISGIDTLAVFEFVFDDFIEYGDNQSSGYGITDGILYKGTTAIKYTVKASTEQIVIPLSLTKISPYAFYGCTSLTEVDFGNVEEIGEYVFANCQNLIYDVTSFTATVAFGAFENCAGALSAHLIFENSSVASKFIDSIIPINYTKITFIGSGTLTQDITGFSLSITEVIVTGYTQIGETAFKNYSLLEEITLEDVTIINNSAFEGLENLKTVNALNLTEIGAKAFYNTASLDTIDLTNVVTVGVSAFELSKRLISINEWDFTLGKTLGQNSLKGAMPVNITANNIEDIIAVMGEGFAANLEELTINGNNIIGVKAFENCANLTKVTFNDDVILQSRAFANCANLNLATFNGACQFDTLKGTAAPFENSPVISVKMRFDKATLQELFGADNTVQSITVFDGGENCIKDYALKNSVATVIEIEEIESIGIEAFSGCKNITSINIPDTVTYIASKAFENCFGLTFITIPISVNTIGTLALQGTKIKAFTAAGDISFNDIAGGFTQFLENLTISEKQGIDKIADFAYKNCTALSNINLMCDISLGEQSFYCCFNVGNIDFTKVINIGANALYGTAITSFTQYSGITFSQNALRGLNLISLTIGGNYTLQELTGNIPDSLNTVIIINGVQSLCDNMFENAKSVINIILPDTLTHIGKYSFYGCSSITKIYLPVSLIQIGDYAFYGCESLSALTLPQNINHIGKYAFGNCIRLENVQLKASLTQISEGLFYNCISLSNANIPYSVTAIGNYAFYNNTKLNNIKLPAGLEKIGSFSFYNNTVLNDLYFPLGITEIGNYAFYGCASFINVNLPENTANVGDYAFAMCIKISSINIPDKIHQLGENILFNCTQLINLILPAQYALATVFGSADNISPLLSFLTFTKGNRTVSANAMANVLTVTQVTLEEGIREIGENAFYNCFTLQSITLPQSIVKIGNGAFYNCSLITEINLTEELLEIGKGAFEQCVMLETINIPSKLYIINDDAFYNCKNLTEITFADNSNLVHIGDYAFMKCASLTQITIPSSVKYIGSWAFSECVALEIITFEQGSLLKVLDDYCFKDTKITTFTLPEKCIYIGWGVFFNCTELSEFILNEGRDKDNLNEELKSENIGRYVFKNTLITKESIIYNDLQDIYTVIFNDVFAGGKN